jgi:hypothetical protein
MTVGERLGDENLASYDTAWGAGTGQSFSSTRRDDLGYNNRR